VSRLRNAARKPPNTFWRTVLVQQDIARQIAAAKQASTQALAADMIAASGPSPVRRLGIAYCR
jgi:hypothetical protein